MPRNRCVGLLLALAAIAVADDSENRAVLNARAAHALADRAALEALAARDEPDPWIVADGLCARGEFDAAEAFARAAPRAEIERLPEYVARLRSLGGADPALRRSVDAANKALEQGKAAELLAGELPEADEVPVARLVDGRGEALEMLDRTAEAIPLYERAAAVCERIGWHRRRARLLLSLAAAKAKRGELEGVEPLLETVASLDGKSRTPALALLALHRLRAGDREGAVERLRRAGKGEGDHTLAVPEAADLALAAAGTGAPDALAPLLRGVDPWLLADELCARGAIEVAVAVAEAAPASGRAPLRAYAESRRGKASNRDWIDAVAEARRLVQLREFGAVLELVRKAKYGENDIASIGLAHLHAVALAFGSDDPKGGAELAAAAAAKAERIGWIRGAAEMRRAAGLLEGRRREPSRAEAQLLECRRLLLASGERKEAAGTLRDIASEWMGADDYPKAVSWYLRAAAEAEECGDDDGLDEALGTASLLLSQLERHEEARAQGERRIALRTRRHDFLGLAEALAEQALALAAAKEHPAACLLYERALELRTATGDAREVAIGLRDLAEALGTLDRPEAVDAFRRAIAAANATGEGELLFLAWRELGAYHFARRRYREAVESYRAAVAQDPGDLYRGNLLPSCWRRLAESLDRLGAKKEAVGAFQQAIRLLEARDETGDLPQVLRDLGHLQKSRGYTRLALDCFEKAERTAGPELKVILLLDRAGIDRTAGRYDRAAEQADEAHRIAVSLGNAALAARALSELSRIQGFAGRGAEAVAAGEEALRSAPDLVERLRALESLGMGLTAAGRREEAERRFAEAVESARAHGDPVAEVRIRLRIAKLHLDAGDAARSLAAAREARGVANAAANPQGEADALHAIVLADSAAGRLEAAVEGVREGRRLRAFHAVNWIEPNELDEIVLASKTGAGDLLDASAQRFAGRLWSFADDLMGRGERQAAIDLARAAKEERLAAFLADAPEGALDAEARRRFKAAVLRGEWPEEQLPLLADPERIASLLLRAQALSFRAIAFEDLRRFEEAERDNLASAAAAHAIGWLTYAIDNQQNAGVDAIRRGDYARAKALLGRAIEWARAAGAEAGLASALGNLAVACEAVSEWAEARMLQEEALAIRERLGKKEGVCRSRWNLGLLCLRLDDLDAARSHLLAALALAEESGMRDLEAGILDTLGGEAMSRGEYAAALDYHDRSIRLTAGRPGPETDLSTVYSNKALVLERMGRLREARELLEKSLELARATNNVVQEARTHSNLAFLHNRLGDYRQAIGHATAAADFWRASGARSGVADALESVANAHRSLGEFARARELWTEVLRIRRETGERAGIAITLGNLGLACRDLGEIDRAFEFHEEELRLRREIGSREGVAYALAHLAADREARGESREAVPLYEEALTIFRETGARSDEASLLGELGGVLRSLGEYGKALDLQQRALVIRQQTKDRVGEARAMAGLANCYADRGDVRRGVELYRQVLPLFEEIGDRDAQATVHENLGKLLTSIGEFGASRSELEKARDLYEKSGARPALGGVLVSIGNLHLALSDLEPAFEEYGRALAIAREVGDRALEMRALGNLASAHSARGEQRKSLERCGEALLIAEALGSRRSVATLLSNMASSHRDLGDFAKALDLEERSLSMRQVLGARLDLAMGYDSMASLQHSLGDFERALELYGKALAIYDEIGDRRGIARALGNLGGTLRESGDLDGSLDHLTRSVLLQEEIGDRGGLARGLVGLGLLEKQAGDLAKARAHLEKGLAIAREIRRPPLENSALLGLSELDARAGELGKARAAQESILASMREQGDRDSEATVLAALAGTLLRQGEVAGAIALAREAVELLPSVLSGLGQAQEAVARERHRGVYEIGALAAARTGDAEALLFFLESARGASALAAIAGREAIRRAALPPELLEEEARAHALERGARQRIERAISNGERDAAELGRRHLEAAERLVREAVDKIERASRAAASLLYPRAASLAGIQGALLPGEALLHFALLPEDLVALVVTRDSARMVKIPEGGRIAGELLAFDPSRRESTDRLAEGLVARLGMDASTRRLLVVPAGPLAAVPFALLAPGREVVYLPSGSLLLLLREGAPPAGEGVLALGDPDYSGRPGLPPLPATRGEATAIGDEILLGKDASESALLERLATRARWRAVHLACHGAVDPERPWRSALALSPDPKGDGQLSPLEIYRARIPADLVALSACDTARGRSLQAEGPTGFVRAFLFAGASRVLVSLWKVDDEATAALMIRFHEEWKRVPAAEALARAQAAVASEEKWRDPRFWAAWQLWGLP